MYSASGVLGAVMDRFEMTLTHQPIIENGVSASRKAPPCTGSLQLEFILMVGQSRMIRSQAQTRSAMLI